MKKKDDTNPYLYILARSDLTSLSCGKLAAQCSHASNAMVYKMKKSGDAKMQNLLHQWESQSGGQGFGTCIVLDCGNEETMIEILNSLKEVVPSRKGQYISGIVNDSSYPIKDGDITHHISLNTCAYVFFDKNDEVLCNVLSDMKLYK